MHACARPPHPALQHWPPTWQLLHQCHSLLMMGGSFKYWGTAAWAAGEAERRRAAPKAAARWPQLEEVPLLLLLLALTTTHCLGAWVVDALADVGWRRVGWRLAWLRAMLGAGCWVGG